MYLAATVAKYVAYLLGVGKVLCQMHCIISMSRGMPWLQTGATQCHAQLGLPDNGRTIKELVVCNNWDLDPLELLKRCGPRLLSTFP